MLRSLIIIAVSTQLLNAQESIPPVSQGKFYHLWFGNNQTNKPAGLLNPETSIEVISVRGNWVEVINISDAKLATVLWLLSEVRRDSELGKKFLEDSGQSREDFLREAELKPAAPRYTKKMWINLDWVTGIQEIEIKK